MPSSASKESLPYWFQGNFAASFVLNFSLRQFLLYAFVNHCELRCEPKQLMLLCYKNRPFPTAVLLETELECNVSDQESSKNDAESEGDYKMLSGNSFITHMLITHKLC